MKSSAAHGSNPSTRPLARLLAERRPGEEHGTGLRRDVNPHQYAELARGWASAGVSFIGGCCGTTPEYIRAITGAVA